MKIRLDRLISDMVPDARSEIKKAIKLGLVLVDGSICKKPETKVDTASQIIYKGLEIKWNEKEYFMLNKPAGCVCAVKDASDPVVVDLLPKIRRQDISPCGRLDKDTEGLLILTNDGELIHRLTSPKKKIPKTYLAVLDGSVTDEMIATVAAGVDIGDEKPTAPGVLKRYEATDAELCARVRQVCRSKEEASGDGDYDICSAAMITLTEGRFHEVKRIFGAFGLKVLYLKRLSMGPIELDPSLKPGECRPLNSYEIPGQD